MKIIAKFSPKGETTITVNGVAGESCRDATRFLERLGKVKSDVPTAEMYEQPASTDVEQNQWT